MMPYVIGVEINRWKLIAFIRIFSRITTQPSESNNIYILLIIWNEFFINLRGNVLFFISSQLAILFTMYCKYIHDFIKIIMDMFFLIKHRVSSFNYQILLQMNKSPKPCSKRILVNAKNKAETCIWFYSIVSIIQRFFI